MNNNMNNFISSKRQNIQKWHHWHGILLLDFFLQFLDNYRHETPILQISFVTLECPKTHVLQCGNLKIFRGETPGPPSSGEPLRGGGGGEGKGGGGGGGAGQGKGEQDGREGAQEGWQKEGGNMRHWL